MRIPGDAAAAVDIREDSEDATTEDTLQPGETFRAAADRFGGRLGKDSVICYARADTGTVTGIVHLTE